MLLTNIWQGSTLVKAFETVERGAFTDSDLTQSVSPAEEWLEFR